MSGATVLYSPQVLALATSLAAFRWDDGLPLQATTRSKSCGSTLTLGLATDIAGRIEKVAMKAQACAIGQAAAAVFASAACGQSAADIAAADQALAIWLAGEGPLPDWPGLDALEPARAYPARHGAIRLAWIAARELLPTG